MKRKSNKSFPEPDNSDMCMWACSYLMKYLTKQKQTFDGKRSGETMYGTYCRLIETVPAGGSRQKLLADMRNAWRQKKHKMKQKREGNSACSFIISETSLAQLKWLAEENKKTLNEALEQIIRRAHAAKKKQERSRSEKAPQKSKYDPTFTDFLTSPIRFYK